MNVAAPPCSASAATCGEITLLNDRVAGRVRLKCTQLYRNDALRDRLQTDLCTIEGVHTVRASVLTGNVLIEYAYTTTDANDALTRLLQHIENTLGAAIGRPQARASRRAAKPERAKKTLPRQSAASSPAVAPPQHLWHVLSGARVLELTESRPEGLRSDEAAQRLARFGPNVLTETKPRSPLSVFFQQFVSAPVALLGLSAVISLATGGIADAAVIVTVVCLNAVIGYVTEKSAEDTINALGQMTPQTATVLRDGAPVEVPLRDIVVGDILVLTPGTYIAADARLLASHRLSVDESPLTGESLPVSKDHDFQGMAETALGDRHNMLYMGTVVTGGSGRAVAIATGRHTEIGEIQALVGSANAPTTPMQQQIDTMGMQLALFSSGICALVFAIGWLRGRPLLEMLMSAMSLAVAAVPEGLPAVATTTLSLGIKQMQKQKVLIRRLPAVENLGSVQVICLDKTGTLTLNKMSVVALKTAEAALTVAHGAFYQDGQCLQDIPRASALWRLFEVVVLCNESRRDERGALLGSATENALLQVALYAGCDSEALRRAYPLLTTEYRAEEHPYMITVHALPENQYFAAIKGSPVDVLARCSHYACGDQILPLTELDRQNWLIDNDRMGAEALRVLGVAYGIYPTAEAYKHEAWIWLGLAGMEDLIRPGMAELMAAFHDAGIATVMITGDQSATAYSVGRRLQLDGNSGEPLEIVDSGRLDKLDPSVLAGLVSRASIFSRVSPAHKLRIVEALQRNGKVVAMTGDGINDGPALKAASVGVTLGDQGTDVARSIADVVIEDDNLATMIAAIRQGRTIYDNIRKSLHFLLSTNLSEIEVMLVSALLGGAEILNPMQLLWINLITDIFPGLALALEPPEEDVMRRPPRDPKEPIISARDYRALLRESGLISAGALGAYGYGVLRYGPGAQASTQAFMTLTLGQLLHAYRCRSEHTSLWHPEHRASNPYLDSAIGFSALLQVVAVVFPPLRNLLRLTPLKALDGLTIAAGATLPLLINESIKQWDRSNPSGRNAA